MAEEEGFPRYASHNAQWSRAPPSPRKGPLDPCDLTVRIPASQLNTTSEHAHEVAKFSMAEEEGFEPS